MSRFVFDDFARTTLSAATNKADDSPVSSAQVQRMVDFLKSPESGPDGKTSYSEYVAKKLRDLPPELPPGMDYVGFSGKDSANTYNYQNAVDYSGDIQRKAGIIGDTPWGKFISELEDFPGRDLEVAEMERKLQVFMDAEGVKPLGNHAGAIRDMMWNAGSPQYFENAIARGKPIVAFVENAPAGRGFSNFELTTALAHPETRINGYPVSAFAADPLAMASKSAAEYQALERSIAEQATKTSGKEVTVAMVRQQVRPIEGYDAVNRTLYGHPLEDFHKLSLSGMQEVRFNWTAAGATFAVETVSEGARVRRLGPGLGVAALGVAATAYETYETGQKVHSFIKEKNFDAAESELSHFAARNVGGWAGGSLAAAAAGTSGLGPMALIAADAYLFSKAFEKAADLRDNNKIYQQEDAAGQHWEYDGGRWVREAELDRSRGGMDNPVETKIAASYEKTQELNAKASAASVTQELGKAPAPQDPFNIPARPEDQRGLDNTHWQRDPQTEQWMRQVKTGVTGANDRGVYAQETATPERAEALDREALSRIQGNITNGREAVAAAYLNDYATRRFEGLVKVPAAVEYAAAKPDAVLGSDSQLYQRNEAGQWTSDGTVAQGNMALELELTRQIRQPTLEATAAALAEVQARPAPTPDEQARSELLHRYQNYGVKLPEEWVPAVELAVERTLQAHGVVGGTMQEPKLAEGAANYDSRSPIVHYQADADGVARVVAVTSTADLDQAFKDVQAQRLAETPIAELPELRITPLSAQERDAHDQALHEANRQGASHEEAAQAASVAAVQAGDSQAAPERAPQPEPAESRQPAAQPTVAPTAPPMPEAAVLAAAHAAAVPAASVQAVTEAAAVRAPQPSAEAKQAEKAQEQSRQRDEAATNQREHRERAEEAVPKPQVPEAATTATRESAAVEKPEQAPPAPAAAAQAAPVQDAATQQAQLHAAQVHADPTQAAPLPEHAHPHHAAAANPAPEVQPQAAAEPTPAPRLTPHDPAHPDHHLYEQIREKVAELDATHGRRYDEASERLTGSLLVLARSNGLERVDHVVLSVATAKNPAAHHVFVVQGELDSPMHQRASMETAAALKPPFEASMQQLEEVKAQENSRAQHQEHQQQREQHEQNERQAIAARSM